MATDSETTEGSANSSQPTGGFQLRGKDGGLFGDDVFGQLKSLEKLHDKFNEETVSERHQMKKFWKSHNESDGDTVSTSSGHNSSHQNESTSSGDLFRRPTLPPPPTSRRQRGRRGAANSRKPAQHWTRYSLEGVGESDEAGNRAAAFQFLEEAKKRREGDNEEESGDLGGKIVFKKREERLTLAESSDEPIRKSVKRDNTSLVEGQSFTNDTLCTFEDADSSLVTSDSPHQPSTETFIKKSAYSISTSRRNNIRRRKNSDSDED